MLFTIVLSENTYMLFTAGRSVLGETVPSGGTQDLGHSLSQYRPPSR